MSLYRGVAVGASAPAFTAPLTTPDGATAETDLASLVADGPVLLAFSPGDLTVEDTREWRAFRDDAWFASDDTVRVVVVSPSASTRHRAFIDTLGLPFSLLADRSHDIAEAYGVLNRSQGQVPSVHRSLFLVDRAGEVRYIRKGDHAIDSGFDRLSLDPVRRAVADLVATEDPAHAPGAVEPTDEPTAPADQSPAGPTDTSVTDTPVTDAPVSSDDDPAAP